MPLAREQCNTQTADKDRLLSPAGEADARRELERIRLGTKKFEMFNQRTNLSGPIRELLSLR